MTEGDSANLPPSGQEPWIDPVIEACKAGIDRTIIRHNLTLTFEQRLEKLTKLMRSIEEMQEIDRKARGGK